MRFDPERPYRGSSSDDYLSSGGVSAPSILSSSRAPAAKPKKNDLYLESYGPQFGVKVTYSMGLTYGLGLLTGSAYGAAQGIRKGEPYFYSVPFLDVKS